MAATMQYVQKMGWGAAEPVDIWLAFENESGGLTEPVVPGVGVVGARDMPVERNRKGAGRVDLQQVFKPTPLELDTLLYYITGGTKTTNAFTPATSVPSFYNWVTRGSLIHKWSGCKINQAVFEAVEGGPLQVTLDIFALDEDRTTASSSFPGGWAVDLTGTPYMMHDCVFSIASTAYKFKNFRLTYNNGLNGDRFLNSNRRVSIPEQDFFTPTWELSGPYGDNAALHGASGFETGVACSATFTNGTRSLLIDSPKVAFDNQPTALENKEWMLPLRGRAQKSGSSASIVFTNDSTA